MLSTIRLFKALPVDNHDNANKHLTTEADLAKETLSKGFIFAPDVLSQYSDFTHLKDVVNQAYGRSSEQLNATFHKSFAKVRDASMQQLVFEQMIHYLTTYGAEHQGVFSHEGVFIPAEQLDAPELKYGLRIVVIRGLTKEELKVELMKLLTSGIALAERTLADVLDVATFVGVDENDLALIKNKEAKSALYDYLGLVPKSPVEFLRFVVFRSTDKTLLIKNKALIQQIKDQKNLDVARYFDTYEKEVGLQHLAQIFYRYKPIFLAFRTNSKMKKSINKIRRLAVVNHKPMQEDLLNTITARLKTNKKPEMGQFEQALIGANTFRKIRLAYALKFRTTDADSILYRVRNGKSYAKEFNFENKKGAEIIYGIILKSIINDIRPNVEGKTIFIPKGLKYGLPATEKQFTGNLPTGTYVEVHEDMVAGIHWENVDRNRIDLDLSISNNIGKIGWDAAYRDGNQDIQFSGDITDAPKPNGASELFHVGGTARGSWLMNLNYYNFNDDVDVPFKILVGQESRENIEKNHTIDPNKIVALSNSVMDVKQKTLGLIVADENSTKFYFAEAEFQKGISARHTAAAEQARKYLLNYYTDSIILNDVLKLAGATIVEEPQDGALDLSFESVDKTTILWLLGEAE